MITKTKGIVLHTVNFSETSVIVKIYTDTRGIQSFLLNGVRKAKSKFKANLLQPLTLVELIANQKENRDIQRISDIAATPVLTNIPYDIAKSSLAFFLAEVLYKSIREEEANENLFAFLMRHIQLLDQNELSCKQFHHYFLMQLTRHLGFFPHGVCNDEFFVFDLREGLFLPTFPPYPEFITSPQALLLHQIANSGFEHHHLIEMNVEARKTLLLNILNYYQLHALHGAKINSHLILEEVLG